MPAIKPEQLEASLRSGKIHSLYLFDGPENWLKEKAVAQIIEKLLPPEARDFNLEKFDGKSSSGGELISSANSLPFLAERRVLVVQAAEEFSTADGRIIGEALPNIPKSSCVIFLYQGKAALKEDIPATVLSYGVQITYWTPFPNQLPMWAINETKRRGKTISFDASQLLVESCTDLQDISNELDKLILFTGKKASITEQDVLAHGLPDSVGNFKELEAGIWTRNLTETLRQAELLSEMGGRSESVFPIFERVFRTLILGHYYLYTKKWKIEEVFSTFNIRAKAYQSNFQEGIKRYTEKELRESLGKIIQADYDIKTGVLPSDISLSLLILNLLQKSRDGVSLAFR